MNSGLKSFDNCRSARYYYLIKRDAFLEDDNRCAALE